MLYMAFSKFGKIVSLKVQRDFETKISKGFAFITFTTSEEADTARKTMNHQLLMNSFLRVCKKKSPHELSSDANLVIKPVPQGISIQELDTFFSQFGSIFSSRLLTNGVGFIQFDEKESVQKCLDL